MFIASIIEIRRANLEVCSKHIFWRLIPLNKYFFHQKKNYNITLSIFHQAFFLLLFQRPGYLE
uniref:Uncharacterized protein n=1 Tax=Arundo donax TaxID=35708 RepID=A0A0A8Z1Q9_ARUDO